MRKNQKSFAIPIKLYNELKAAAKEKSQTLEQYVDDLILALIYTNPKVWQN
jgi:hypothetical protein